MRSIDADKVFRLLEHACGSVARDLKSGELEPLQGYALVVSGNLLKPGCVGGHIFTRAFGMPQVAALEPVSQLERAFALCLRSNFRVPPDEYGLYWNWLGGHELTKIMRLNDDVLMTWTTVRPLMIAAVQGLATVCRSIRDNIASVDITFDT